MGRLVAFLTILVALLASRTALAEGTSTAIYYGRDIPYELFAHYDRVVVEADHFGAMPRSSRAQILAYVSVGEIHPSRSWYKDVPGKLVIGRNGTWSSDVVDTRSVEWQAFLLDRVIEPLWKQGYRGFFLTRSTATNESRSAPARKRSTPRGSEDSSPRSGNGIRR
jgi:hypothetical protein